VCTCVFVCACVRWSVWGELCVNVCVVEGGGTGALVCVYMCVYVCVPLCSVCVCVRMCAYTSV